VRQVTSSTDITHTGLDLVVVRRVRLRMELELTVAEVSMAGAPKCTRSRQTIERHGRCRPNLTSRPRGLKRCEPLCAC
jgi:hypothetical protein